jgi:hypothetical protein
VRPMLVILAACGLIGTTCAHGLNVRQRLLPNPPTDCLLRTLANDPAVPAVDRRRAWLYLTLRDSTAPHRERTASVHHWAPPDSGGKVEVTFVWVGWPHRVPAAEQRAVIALATQLLSEFRRACAPETPAPVE